MKNRKRHHSVGIFSLGSLLLGWAFALVQSYPASGQPANSSAGDAGNAVAGNVNAPAPGANAENGQGKNPGPGTGGLIGVPAQERNASGMIQSQDERGRSPSESDGAFYPFHAPSQGTQQGAAQSAPETRGRPGPLAAGVSDTVAEKTFRSAIAADNSLSSSAQNVKIAENHGKVTLTGTVSSQAEKDAIAAKAAAFTGADNVVNRITISGPRGRRGASSSSNPTITRNFHKAILADKSLSSAAQNVQVVEGGGKVTLTGSVQSKAEADNIVAKAGAFVGAGNVINNMTVQGSQ